MTVPGKPQTSWRTTIPARAVPNDTETVSETPPAPAVSIACKWSGLKGIGCILRSFRGSPRQRRDVECPCPSRAHYFRSTVSDTQIRHA